MRRFWSVLLTISFVAALTCAASAKPIVSLKLSGTFVMQSADGTERFVPVNTRDARPGERIRWEILATNSGNAVARNFVPAGKIATNTAYLANSAVAGNTKVEYSIDGGKTWSTAPTITLHGGDGDKVVRADASAYTAIRWLGTGALAPGATRRYVYDVIVR